VNPASKLYLGPAGWSYPDWNGRVYPRRRPNGFHPLTYLARFFNLMEINTTFYAPQSREAAEDWVGRVAHHPDFQFLVKLWGRCTHEDAWPSAGELRNWSEVLRPLIAARKFGGLLAQFPASLPFGGRVRDRLDAIRQAFPTLPIACELRDRNALTDECLRFLTDHRLAFVNIDQPLGNQNLPPSSLATADWAYVRLHGRNSEAWFDPKAGRDARYDYRYSKAELLEWAPRIRSLGDQCTRVVVVGNNHFHGKALAGVLELAHILSDKLVPIPDTLLDQYPDLAPLCSPDPDRLFP
jgi:uncharacterized protein YecE (DUF72 family)